MRKLFTLFLTFVLAVPLWAVQVSYVDAEGVTQTLTEGQFTLLQPEENDINLNEDGFYVVGVDYNNDGKIDAADAEQGQTTHFTVQYFGGYTSVNLILSDGFTLTADYVSLNEINLTIYGQEEGTGLFETNNFYIHEESSLTVNGGEFNVTGGGIGIYESSTLTVNGGEVNVTEGEIRINESSTLTVNGGEFNVNGGGIDINNSSTLIVNGGKVNVTEGDIDISNSSTMTVNYGEVNVTNGYIVISDASTLTMHGGEVNVTEGGIDISESSTLTVNGGEVNVNGGIRNENSTITVADNMLIYVGYDETEMNEISNDEPLLEGRLDYPYVTIVDVTASVVKAINAIGEVTYTDECKAKIDAARSAYNALNEELKVYVSNFETLTTAETTYEQLKTVAPVVEAINAIGTVTYTDESKAKIDAARTAYNALTAAQKELVTNYSTLTDAETAYAQLKPLVVSYVDADGTTKTLNGGFTLIDGADLQNTKSGYYVVGADYNGDGVINAADAAYATTKGLKTNFISDYLDGFSDDLRLILIDGFTLTLNYIESYSNATLTLYGQEEGTGLISAESIKIEVDAHMTVNGGEVNTTSIDISYESSLTVNGGEVNVTLGGIDIDDNSTLTVNGGEVNVNGGIHNENSTITVADNMLIYVGYDETEMNEISNDEPLLEGRLDYPYVTIVDGTANVVKAINAIGTVTYTDECKAKIDAARTAYNALSEELKENVSNFETLTTAETTYEQLKTVAPVVEAINAIGTVTYTDECKAKIDAARTAYDALTSAQQELVSNYSTLTDAETAYAQLKPLVVSYVDADGTTKTLQKGDFTLINSTNKFSNPLYKGGFYVVGADYNDDGEIDADDAVFASENGLPTNFTYNGKVGVDVEGANLILADGFTFTINGNDFAIEIKSSNVTHDSVYLAIYGQKEETGTLTGTLKNLDDGQSIYIGVESSMIINGGRVIFNDENNTGLFFHHANFQITRGVFEIFGDYAFWGYKSTISVAENLEVYGDENNPPTTLIANDENLYSNLEDNDNVLYLTIVDKSVGEVKTKIDAIGKVEYTEECKTKIDAARSAYDALTKGLQLSVSNYETLTAAETTYNDLTIASVVAKINAIGTVTYTDECKTKIEAARSAYDALTDAQKALVSNVETLTDAEEAYNQLKTDNQAAEAVIAKINEIGKVEYAEECKDKIDAAREAYDALTDDQKALVSNVETLTDAEEAYNQLKTDNQAAEAVVAKIDEIGTVTYTEECEDKIDDAYDAYELLTDDQKELVSNYATLIEANDTYDQLEADNEAAEAVVAKINEIGTVTYTEESKEKIDAARDAYNALTNAQKALVSNYTIAEEAVDAYNELCFNHLAAEAVSTKIKKIGTVTYTEESKDKIDDAREAYDALTNAQKELVSNYATLTDAEDAYDQLEADNEAAEAVVAKIDKIGTVTYTEECESKIVEADIAYNQLTEAQQALVTNYTTLTEAEEAYDQLKTDNEAAAEVVAKINKIGTVTYTEESKDKIDDAREAYDALTNAQKELVSNYATLTDAEDAYDQLKTDNEAAADVVAKINEIGTVTYTAECESKIVEADIAYNQLTEAQQALVTNYTTLTAAEETYDQLKTDNEAAAEVVAKINKIGTVTYTEESKDKIDDAREAYDALTNAQKELVSNYATLTDAEEAYDQLKTDNEAAADVVAKINEIGTVTYTAECESKIVEADIAYNQLTEAQQALVTNYTTLTAAEETYDQLKIDNETAAEVDAIINKIGTVTYTPESKEKIDAARTAYNALTTAQQAMVSNVETLTEAETTYDQLKENAEAVASVISKIEAIGTVAYTEESKSKIEAARTAYDALNKDLQSEVANYLSTLTDAEEAYDQLKTDNEAAEAVVAKINEIGTAEYTTESKAKIDAARTAYDALTVAQKALVINVETLTEAEETYDQLESETTLVEEVISNPTNSAYKIIKEGRVLIVKDGAMYTLNGQKVE